MTRRSDWPASPLQAAGRAFDLLSAPPMRHTFDGRTVPGLPRRDLALPDLKRTLLSPATSAPQRDAIWRELVALTRRDDPGSRTWIVLVVGLALPGLTRIAASLTRGWDGDVADVDGEVLAGFLLRLKTLDTTGRRVLGRLLDAATRAGRKARADDGDGEVVRVPQSWSAPPAHPWAHPDWVLARAVAAGVLDRTEARLIGATRLEDVTVKDAAAALDVTVSTALAWRRTAESRLASAIAEGDLDHVVLRASQPGRLPGGLTSAAEQRLRRRHQLHAGGRRPVVAAVAP
jgi:transposase-like protein